MSRGLRRPARSAIVVLGGLLLAGIVVGGPVTGQLVPGGFGATSFAASEAESGVELLVRARDASTSYDFSGEVVVEWRADGRLQRERVPVRETDGVLRVGEQRKIIGAGDDRIMARDGVWKRLWTGPSDSTRTEPVAVDPERKYTLTVSDGPRTAGRGTTLVEVSRADRGDKDDAKAGRETERFAVDDETGLLLRREQLDRRGHLERAVRFVALRDPTPISTSDPDSKADETPNAKGTAPKVITNAKAASDAPRRLGDGFTLTGRYRAADGSKHFFYSDGIYTASVFEQAGDLDRQELPDDATSSDFAGRRLTNYSTPTGTVVVWADDDRVYTLVSDAPKRDLDALVGDLPAASDAGTATEVARFVLGPFRW